MNVTGGGAPAPAIIRSPSEGTHEIRRKPAVTDLTDAITAILKLNIYSQNLNKIA